MMHVSSPSYAGKLYDYLDYVPFISTLKSLYSIFQKYINSDLDDLQYTGFSKGSLGRDFTLLVPFFGNMTVAVYDALTKESKLEIEIESLKFPSRSTSSGSWSALSRVEETTKEVYDRTVPILDRIARCMCFLWCSKS